MQQASSFAEQRRAEIRARAAAMGIDEAYISTLVDAFYARIRTHPVLGPVFLEAIGEDWSAHLPRMKQFWASVVLNAGTYSGRPVPVHQALTDIRPEHFRIWLDLFRQTLDDTAPSEEAAEVFMDRAERIAESLQLAMFSDVASLDPKKRL